MPPKFAAVMVFTPGRHAAGMPARIAASIERPATFRYACTYRPPHVGLLLRYLRGRAGVPVADRYVAGKYERYSGDLAELGKGEILQWAGE